MKSSISPLHHRHPSSFLLLVDLPDFPLADLGRDTFQLAKSQFSPDTCHISSSPGLARLVISDYGVRGSLLLLIPAKTRLATFSTKKRSPTFTRPSLDRPAPHFQRVHHPHPGQDSQSGTGHCQSVRYPYCDLQSTTRLFVRSGSHQNSHALVAPSYRAFASLRSIQLHPRLFQDSISRLFVVREHSSSIINVARILTDQLEPRARPDRTLLFLTDSRLLPCRKGPLHRRYPTSDFPECRRGPPLAPRPRPSPSTTRPFVLALHRLRHREPLHPASMHPAVLSRTSTHAAYICATTSLVVVLYTLCGQLPSTLHCAALPSPDPQRSLAFHTISARLTRLHHPLHDDFCRVSCSVLIQKSVASHLAVCRAKGEPGQTAFRCRMHDQVQIQGHFVGIVSYHKFP